MMSSNGIIVGQDTSHHAGILAKNGYEASLVGRALGRAGNNPHLKGHIQELIVKDMRNAEHLLRMNGATTELTRSTTAPVVDLVTTKGGRVIERIQVKDVTSNSGLNKLVKQCADGKYRSAKLVGSDETAQAFNKMATKAGISKRMTSTGVSSKTTESLAQRAGCVGSGSLSSAMSQAAKSGGVAGVLVGAGVESVKGCYDWYQGKASGLEVTGRIASASAKGGLSGASASAAATLAGTGAATAATALGLGSTAALALTVGAPIVAAVAVGCAASAAYDTVSGWISDLF